MTESMVPDIEEQDELLEELMDQIHSAESIDKKKATMTIFRIKAGLLIAKETEEQAAYFYAESIDLLGQLEEATRENASLKRRVKALEKISRTEIKAASAHGLIGHA